MYTVTIIIPLSGLMPGNEISLKVKDVSPKIILLGDLWGQNLIENDGYRN